jgi:hypothetical protein
MHGVERASGTLLNISPDEIQIRESGTNTLSYDKNRILWVERNVR